MVLLSVGIDEIATETQLSSGWCYFLIRNNELANMKSEVDALLQTANLRSFHAKKFIQSETTHYEQFLRIIRKYIQQSNPSILSSILNNPSWNDEYIRFCEKLFSEVLRNVGANSSDFINVLKRFVPPLFQLQSLTRNLEGQYEFFIEIDSDDVKERYPFLKTKIKDHDFNSSFFIEKFFNHYRNRQFPGSPRLAKDGLQVMKDQKSILIQAADTIGNFSNAYIFYKLGNKSKKRVLKAKIFNNVFGDRFSHVDFNNEIEIVNNNDLRLKKDGAFTLAFGRYK
jgi:hypothetical protein